MNVFDHPDRQAIALIEILGYERALSHAVYWHREVISFEATEFWEKVIHEMKQRKP